MIVGYSRTFGTALPTTNLRLQFDASVGGNVWKTRIAANPCWTTPAVDGDTAEVWKSTIPAPNSEVVFASGSTGSSPLYKTASPALRLPDLLFDGSNDILTVRQRSGGSTDVPLSTYMTTTAGTMLMSFQIHSATANNASPTNAILLDEAGKTCGMQVRRATTGPDTYKLQFYNDDGGGGVDAVETSVLANTSYVAYWRHDSTTLYGKVHTGTEVSIASGTTANLNDALHIGGDGGRFLSCSVGEVLVYNVCLTGTDLDNAVNYLKDKWV